MQEGMEQLDAKTKDHDSQRWSNRGWVMIGVRGEGKRLEVGMVSKMRTDAMVQKIAEQQRTDGLVPGSGSGKEGLVQVWTECLQIECYLSLKDRREVDSPRAVTQHKIRE